MAAEKITNPVVLRARTKPLLIAQSSDERDRLLRIISPSKIVLPKIQDIPNGHWYDVLFGKRITNSTRSYVGKTISAVRSNGKSSDQRYSGDIGSLSLTADENKMDHTAKEFKFHASNTLEQILRSETSSTGLFNLFLLSYADFLRTVLIDNVVSPKESGILTKILKERMLSEKTSSGKDRRLNSTEVQQIYDIATEYICPNVRSVIKSSILDLGNTSPYVIQKAFGGIAMPESTEALIKQLFIENPWIFTNFDPKKPMPEDFEKIIARTYSPLDPVWIRKIQEAAGKENSELIISKNLIDLAKKEIKSRKEEEQLQEMSKILAAYRKYLRDVAALQAIRTVQEKIITKTEVQTDEEQVVDSNEKRRIFSFETDKKPSDNLAYKALISLDIVGSTKLTTTLGEYMNDEEMKDRQVFVLNELEKLARGLGFETVNRMGDAGIFSGHSILNVVYYAYQVAHNLLPRVRKSLAAVEDARKTHLEHTVKSLEEELHNASNSLGEDTPLGRIRKAEISSDLRATQIELTRHEKRRELLEKQLPMMLRAGICEGYVVEGERDVIGEAINLSNRLTKHKQHESPPYDVGIHNGELDNVYGYVLSEPAVAALIKEAESAGIKVYKNVVKKSGKSIDVVCYREQDGTQIWLRDEGQEKARLSEFGESRVWKLIVDDSEMREYADLIKSRKG